MSIGMNMDTGKRMNRSMNMGQKQSKGKSKERSGEQPQVSKSTLSVIRLKPTQQINYDINRNQFQHIRGNFGAQFRRYALSPDGATLTLSELVVLEVPGNIVISFPTTARDMIFSRMFTQPSAVAPTSWGRIKQIR